MSWQTIVKENDLEVSVVRSSKLGANLRLDADFYNIYSLFIEEKINKNNHILFKDLLELLTDYTSNGSFASLKQNVSLDDESGYAKWIRIKNLDKNSYNEDIRYVNKKGYDFLKKTKLFGGEILISKTGEYLGKAYLFPNTGFNATLADNIFLIRTKNNLLNNSFLIIYLNSKVGQSFIKKFSQGGGQPTIIKDSLRSIPIPIPSNDFQKIIEDYYKIQQNLLVKSSEEYREAEQFFLKEINLDGYKATDENISVRNFKDCITANRFDAEYWQSKYDEIEKRVSSIPQKNLEDIVLVNKGIETGSEEYSEEGKLFIRVSDFSIYGIDEGEKKISEELYEKLKENYRPRKGEVLFTKDGTIGISFSLHEDIDVIVSGAFLRLKPKVKINNDYLALVLNSSYCKAQIERMSGGAIIAHLKPDSAKKIKIPMLSDKKQEELAKKVSDALRLRKEAKTLLKKAKRAVEIFIEQDEKEAIIYLSKKL